MHSKSAISRLKLLPIFKIDSNERKKELKFKKIKSYICMQFDNFKYFICKYLCESFFMSSYYNSYYCFYFILFFRLIQLKSCWKLQKIYWKINKTICCPFILLMAWQLWLLTGTLFCPNYRRFFQLNNALQLFYVYLQFVFVCKQ
jgi:hypothetical protein